MSLLLLDFLYQHDGHVALLQALLLCAGLFVARKEVLVAWLELGRSTRWGFLGLGVLGMIVPLLVFPTCLLYTSPSPRDKRQSRMPSSA